MPKIWEELVTKLKNEKGVDNVYALATSILQKKGVLKKGTRKLKKKKR